MIKINYKIEGMEKLERSLDKLGKVPQKHVTSSAKKGMNIALKEAKKNAPEKTGNLIKGLISVGETANKKGKKVYRVVFDSKMNDIFQKRNKDGKVTGYYPFSQEYGFFSSKGKYIPGLKFARNALANNTSSIEKSIMDSMQKKIDKELAKGGLKK